MRRLITLCAAAALAFPGVATATHVTDHDGPAVGALPAICKSTPGQAWFASQVNALALYTLVGDRVKAAEHWYWVAWYITACRLTVR